MPPNIVNADCEEEKKTLISVVIRCKNEERYLQQVLDSIMKQQFTTKKSIFEIIIVDNESTDWTLDIIDKHNTNHSEHKIKVVTIPKWEFTHPKSSNLGAETASWDYIAYLNGHSIPISPNYLQDWLSNFLKDDSVGWVYAKPYAHKDGTLADFIMITLNALINWRKRFEATRETGGVLATIACMIRKKDRKLHNYQEINGGFWGEDVKYAHWLFDQGLNVIHDPKFRVRHSHHLRLKDIWRQRKNRKKMWPDSGLWKPEKQRVLFKKQR